MIFQGKFCFLLLAWPL